MGEVGFNFKRMVMRSRCAKTTTMKANAGIGNHVYGIDRQENLHVII